MWDALGARTPMGSMKYEDQLQVHAQPTSWHAGIARL
jgi:hypothetical protein